MLMLRFKRGKKNKKYNPNGYWLDNLHKMSWREYYEFITFDVLHCPFEINVEATSYLWCANRRGSLLS